MSGGWRPPPKLRDRAGPPRRARTARTDRAFGRQSNERHGRQSAPRAEWLARCPVTSSLELLGFASWHSCDAQSVVDRYDRPVDELRTGGHEEGQGGLEILDRADAPPRQPLDQAHCRFARQIRSRHLGLEVAWAERTRIDAM